MKYRATLIVVENIEKSRDFYENVLGQTVKDDYGENVVFVGDFAIHQKEHFQKLIGNKTILKGSNSSELYFEHDDLKSVVQKIKDLKLEFVHEIIEQPWKQRVVRFYDFDKNLIEIGERLEYVAYRLFKENYPIEEISKIIYLSKKDVEEAIKEYTETPS